MTSRELVRSLLHSGEAAVTDRVAVATRVGDRWDNLTYAGLDRRSSATAAGLAAAGVRSGDRVALLAEPGNEWITGLLGIWRRGAVAVLLDASLTADELVPLCRRSELAAGLVSATLAGRWDSSTPVVDLAGDEASSPGAGAEAERRLDDPAVIVWTSGTTGRPKGVTLSFANLDYVVSRASQIQGLGPDARWLSVLPPNHLLELCCGRLPALAAGSTTFVVRTVVPHELASIMRETRVTQMVVVPLVLRLLKRHIESAARKPGAAGAYLRTATRLADGPVRSTAQRRLLFAPVHRRLGGHLRSFYCGGAPVEAEVVTFFHRLGIEVFQGYGLTETSPVVSMNSPGHNRPGSVGRPLPSTEVRISDEGEILVRGPGVMLGYWNDDEATAEAVDVDGWLHTGDLGRVDPDGYLFVTGRVKSLIVLDSGKKVQPEEVEEALARSPRFTEVCVVGWHAHTSEDGAGPAERARAGEQVCAVVVPSEPMSVQEAEEEVHRLTAGLSGFKRPTVIRLHDGELPKTPKRSPRRAEVVRMLGHVGTPP
ncbi:MAG: AMP-binding protein [Actinobacteria bacterium]|nr:AMP-binding protein [Actinomycetota bacterium]